jgi:uncharacterized protein
MDQIEYPCDWSYRLICTDEGVAKRAVARVFGSREHTLKQRNSSSKGSFVSLDLNCSVDSEEDKKNLNTMLRQQPGIKMIL